MAGPSNDVRSRSTETVSVCISWLSLCLSLVMLSGSSLLMMFVGVMAGAASPHPISVIAWLFGLPWAFVLIVVAVVVALHFKRRHITAALLSLSPLVVFGVVVGLVVLHHQPRPVVHAVRLSMGIVPTILRSSYVRVP